MTTNTVTEEREDLQQDSSKWRRAELAPSDVRPDEPVVARVFGMLGLFVVLVAGIAWYMNAAGKTTLITAILGPILAPLGVVLGLGALLFHAVWDHDLQVRRTYMALGGAWLALGTVLSLVPVEGNAGAMFLPWGVTCMTLGLLFLMTFLRQETDPAWREPVIRVVGAIGVVLGVAGFLFSNVKTDFLLSHGFVMILLGLLFWWVFVVFTGVASDLGYRAALGLGALGLVGFLVALGRSALPPLLASWGGTSPATSYAIPAGLMLMSAGLLYMAISVGMWSDSRLMVLTRREMAAFFFSPLAYIVLFGIIVVAWMVFLRFVNSYLWLYEPIAGRSQVVQRLEPILTNYIVDLTPVMCATFIVPVLTMRLLSEEQRTGTMEVMLTAPLDEITVVMSKFLAAFVFFMLLWLPFGLNLVALRVEGGNEFDYRPILSFFIALACSGAGFLSMGLFFSSLTRNQLTAAVLTFVGMLFLLFVFLLKFVFGDEGGQTNVWTMILNHVSYIDLWYKSLKGQLPLRDLIFHLSAAVFWLFLTVKVLESRKWR
jgi:ABC-type transport system involved in multi-copper enzyme maturation permease subunit